MPIFITQKIRASDQNVLQIRILHRKIHRKKNILFYMTLKDNNTAITLILKRNIFRQKRYSLMINYDKLISNHEERSSYSAVKVVQNTIEVNIA